MIRGRDEKIPVKESCAFSLPASNPDEIDSLVPCRRTASKKMTRTTKTLIMIDIVLARRSSESFLGKVMRVQMSYINFI